MQWNRHITEAVANLMSTKLRTFLAVLGILVGTASVVAMVSGGQLATRQALAQFKQLGTNLLSIQISQATGGEPKTSSQKLNLATVEAIKKRVPGLELVAPYTSTYPTVTYQGHTLSAGVLGVTQALQPMMKLHLQAGRFISFLDSYENYCVIGKEIYESIKQHTVKDPVGQQLDVNGTFYTIVGVLNSAAPNSFVFADLNQSILIPILSSMTLSKYARITSVVFKVKEGADINQLQASMKDYFNEVVPDKQLYFQSAKQIIASMHKQQSILTVFLGFIGSISLLVGGIGVMNIMLVSVTERKREIGIRLAIGAHRRDIRLMFLIEAVVLSLFGGIVGVILGILISFVIAEAKGWPFTIFLLPPTIGFGVSVLTGIFFGYYPAYKASKLDPIQTLRVE